ncbi:MULTISPECIES: hypothetical protein [Pseudoxanthomonas]|uniref:Lipoprotein n=1 Tax=Pseudoxanthomonas winnipegensis TaxID=2480810 RepID=A0A4Q8M3T0_9GAMM|nr:MULTISPECIES: hypothetical protein [Pseudoxanthomonas]MDQ1119657.1 hypothetical protein [Pseudoxanthomonas winnipegensis]MDQ1132852.1 hypothetical protein [Pseudoxanthomonas winnipegensis]MDR6137141.1 hypothetical protein [Pseudoxanthomonas sp. SORGH_AS_0997]TAA42405.1 hypothetical protein EA655_10240 [Pseudoxanthomonas winnipegensis]
MQAVCRIALLVLTTLTSAACARWQAPDASDPHGMAFQLIGCDHDWPSDVPMEAIVRRETGNPPSYFVRDPVECGMDVTEPRYRLSGNTLFLSYTTKVPANGEVGACACEYDSRFTFRTLPASVRNVRFEQH